MSHWSVRAACSTSTIWAVNVLPSYNRSFPWTDKWLCWIIPFYSTNEGHEKCTVDRSFGGLDWRHWECIENLSGISVVYIHPVCYRAPPSKVRMRRSSLRSGQLRAIFRELRTFEFRGNSAQCVTRCVSRFGDSLIEFPTYLRKPGLRQAPAGYMSYTIALHHHSVSVGSCNMPFHNRLHVRAT